VNRRIGSALALAVLLAAASGSALAASARLVSIKTPRGVKQAFILVTPAKPSASLIMFAGGSGGLGLHSATSMQWGATNFVVRTRDMFAAQGFAVAVVDSPSDRRKGMNAIFRMSAAHAGDIAAVAAYLKKQANVPVWLVGTSMARFRRRVAASPPAISTASCSPRRSPAPIHAGKSPRPTPTA
jgi:dienelactone hydrolase